MKVELFIENKKIELSEDIVYSINKEFEDLNNPTALINDWTKTVSIIGTQENNQIFGHLYNITRSTVESGNGNVGINFDPTKKLNFRLVYGLITIMEGYAKMVSVKRQSGTVYYEVNLFGELGRVFQDLQRITFDKNADSSKQIIDIRDYLSYYRAGEDDVFTKEIVKQSWDNLQSSTKLPILAGHPATIWYNIWGFGIGNLGYNSDFDSKSIQNSSTETVSVNDILGGDEWSTATGLDIDAAIGDGILPRQLGEYRAYYNFPYVYMNQLFNIFKEEGKKLGYTLVYDGTWFNDANPYFKDLVYTLPIREFVDETASNRYSFSEGSQNYTSWISYWNKDSGATNGDATAEGFSNPITATIRRKITEDKPIEITSDRIFKIGSQAVSVDIPAYITFWDNESSGVEIYLTNMFILKIRIAGEKKNKEITVGFHNGRIESTYFGSECDYYIACPTFTSSETTLGTIIQEVITPSEFGSFFQITYSGGWKKKNNVMQCLGAKWNTVAGAIKLPDSSQDIQLKINFLNSNSRSYSNCDLNSLWNKEETPFDVILKYCKLFRIFVYTKDGIVYFKPLAQYFKNPEIINWTDKVDFSKDYIITPIATDYKYFKFNYEDSDNKLNESYSKKYGLNYGELKVNTNYNFNDEDKDLFEGLNTSIVSRENIYSWSDMFTRNIIFRQQREVMPSFADKDNKTLDTGGCFLFRNNNQSVDSNLRRIYITDDTPFQVNTNNFCYIDPDRLPGYRIFVNTIPTFNIVDKTGQYCCLYNIPSESYGSTVSGASSIYDNFWKSWMSERYNKNNKKLTAQVRLTTQDINDFSYNKFIIIDNTLFMVNKIYDYNPNSPYTKVDFIQITDPSKYSDLSFFTRIPDTLVLNLAPSARIWFDGNIDSDYNPLATFESTFDITWKDGTLEYRDEHMGMMFKIDNINKVIYAKRYEKYTLYEDLVMTDIQGLIKSSEDTYFDFYIENDIVKRYSAYPYPYFRNSEVHKTSDTTGTFTVECCNIDGKWSADSPSVKQLECWGMFPTGTVFELDSITWDSEWHESPDFEMAVATIKFKYRKLSAESQSGSWYVQSSHTGITLSDRITI